MDTHPQQPNGAGETHDTGADAADPVDLNHLRRFTLGDQELEREVLRLFIEQAPVTIANLKCADSDREWTSAAHTLKGSARAVGAWRLAELAEQAERLGRARDRSVCDQVLCDIDEATRQARHYIASLDQPT